MRYVFLFLLIANSIFAQEVLTPLLSVPRALENNSSINKSSLNLPFFDDFSSNQLSPSLWIGNSALVNNNYPINPPSIGVVTFLSLIHISEPTRPY